MITKVSTPKIAAPGDSGSGSFLNGLLIIGLLAGAGWAYYNYVYLPNQEEMKKQAKA